MRHERHLQFTATLQVPLRASLLWNFAASLARRGFFAAASQKGPAKLPDAVKVQPLASVFVHVMLTEGVLVLGVGGETVTDFRDIVPVNKPPESMPVPATDVAPLSRPDAVFGT